MKDMLDEVHLTNSLNFVHIDLIVEVLYRHNSAVYMSPIDQCVHSKENNFASFHSLDESNVWASKQFENEDDHDLNIHLVVHENRVLTNDEVSNLNMTDEEQH